MKDIFSDKCEFPCLRIWVSEQNKETNGCQLLRKIRHHNILYVQPELQYWQLKLYLQLPILRKASMKNEDATRQRLGGLGFGLLGLYGLAGLLGEFF